MPTNIDTHTQDMSRTPTLTLKANLDLEHDLEHDLSHDAHPDGPREHGKEKKFIFNSPKKEKKMAGLQVTQSVKGLDSLGPMHQLTFDLLKLGPIFFK